MKFKILELVIHLATITFLVLAIVRPVAAQGVEKEATVTATQEEATEAAKPKSTYQLPYPGLLPDHPLYVLKATRDRIIDFLITDSLKKAEFTLLQADKRLSMAIALVEKGKQDLAESTVSKGETYMDRSVGYLEKARAEGKDVAGFSRKLIASLEKHEEVLLGLAAKTEGNLKERFSTLAAEAANTHKNLQK